MGLIFGILFAVVGAIGLLKKSIAYWVPAL